MGARRGKRVGRGKSFQLKLLDLPIRRIRTKGHCLFAVEGLLWCPPVGGPKSLPTSSLKEGPQNVQIYNNRNYFVSGRRQNGHFGLLLSVNNLQDGQCVEDRPRTSGIWRKLEKLGAPICRPSPSQVNK